MELHMSEMTMAARRVALPELPPVDRYGAHPDGNYSAESMREYALEAVVAAEDKANHRINAAYASMREDNEARRKAEAALASETEHARRHFEQSQRNAKMVAELEARIEKMQASSAAAVRTERDRAEHAIKQQLLNERRYQVAEAELAALVDFDSATLTETTLSRPPAQDAPGAVKVKRLEWSESGPDLHVAPSAFGLYRITSLPTLPVRGYSFTVWSPGVDIPKSDFGTFADAMAGAQADYDRRILAALEAKAEEHPA